jgi:hypothetical protein
MDDATVVSYINRPVRVAQLAWFLAEYTKWQESNGFADGLVEGGQDRINVTWRRQTR